MTTPLLPRIDLEITTDGSWDGGLGGCAFAIMQQDGRCAGKIWRTRHDTDSTAVELKGIRGALDTLLSAVVARPFDFPASETKYAAIWTDCLDAVCEIDLQLGGRSEDAIRRSNGRVSSVTHVDLVKAIVDAKSALEAKGVVTRVAWQPRVSYPQAKAADEWARKGVVLARQKAGSWNVGLDHVYPKPKYFSAY
ncbi:hypothetical protein CLAFUW4_10670 [Fulvia fulva]|uniref:RNase H type-1 domain-containing protein n=1 Tax=Passalora fulva TaxID=5499 RepID=A0A9Q8P804_PASFU|nr:uncharacterized protein CLAFUR5_05283 [Fulvia fulva]KAK4615628.1 hypothetical protein CLAFUR4_10675 [Fulvia fulva]KAK4616561.1 hypothetical protein CLAFUR0_10568 [Fulvia fulva]UJO16591.1 hypothetical protein CLAFUR5_05283 [Fulvia fulva]WPV18833.1 hypothetical protein CLAFUW4_10670 [Fulvia fulva]WPV34429.1 hypothetical protein CLAFUW7_10672 [Fulvia fulva]